MRAKKRTLGKRRINIWLGWIFVSMLRVWQKYTFRYRNGRFGRLPILSLWGEDAGGKRMTLEEYIKEQRERVANMTLAQARQIVANHYGHDDMRIECEKAVKMLLDCADEKINGGWIPVTERLPKVEEEATRCLVTVDVGGSFDDYTAIRTYFSDTKDFNDVVTAWMPLPKPYKGGQEDGKA